MKKPVEPSKEDCCNSGCNPCVFDVYEKQLKLYEEFLKNGKESHVAKENTISQLEYTRFTLLDNLELCSLHRLLVFKRTDSVIGRRVFWSAGDHFLVKYDALGEVCSRAYTPIRYKTKDYDADFTILVKKCENGLVSTYLCNMTPGQESSWRGPYGNYELVINEYARIIMIAQGTGIAPFYSIIENILNNEDDYAKIVLLFCCSSSETIILRDELYSFKCYWNFQYIIFTSNTEECVSKFQEPIKHRKLEFNDINELAPFSVKDQFLLCGSSTFMNEYNSFLRKEHICIDNIVLF